MARALGVASLGLALLAAGSGCEAPSGATLSAPVAGNASGSEPQVGGGSGPTPTTTTVAVSPRLDLSWSSTSASTGSTVTLTLRAEPSGMDLMGLVTRLNFDPTRLQWLGLLSSAQIARARAVNSTTIDTVLASSSANIIGEWRHRFRVLTAGYTSGVTLEPASAVGRDGGPVAWLSHAAPSGQWVWGDADRNGVFTALDVVTAVRVADGAGAASALPPGSMSEAQLAYALNVWPANLPGTGSLSDSLPPGVAADGTAGLVSWEDADAIAARVVGDPIDVVGAALPRDRYAAVQALSVGQWLDLSQLGDSNEVVLGAGDYVVMPRRSALFRRTYFGEPYPTHPVFDLAVGVDREFDDGASFATPVAIAAPSSSRFSIPALSSYTPPTYGSLPSGCAIPTSVGGTISVRSTLSSGTTLYGPDYATPATLTVIASSSRLVILTDAAGLTAAGGLSAAAARVASVVSDYNSYMVPAFEATTGAAPRSFNQSGDNRLVLLTLSQAGGGNYFQQDTLFPRGTCDSMRGYIHVPAILDDTYYNAETYGQTIAHEAGHAIDPGIATNSHAEMLEGFANFYGYLWFQRNSGLTISELMSANTRNIVPAGANPNSTSAGVCTAGPNFLYVAYAPACTIFATMLSHQLARGTSLRTFFDRHADLSRSTTPGSPVSWDAWIRLQTQGQHNESTFLGGFYLSYSVDDRSGQTPASPATNRAFDLPYAISYLRPFWKLGVEALPYRTESALKARVYAEPLATTEDLRHFEILGATRTVSLRLQRRDGGNLSAPDRAKIDLTVYRLR